MKRLTFAKASAELRYDERTGLLWWRKPKQGRRLDRPAGRTTAGRYVDIGIDYQQYGAHQIVWLLKTGKWLSREVDHKNTKRRDNRWCNLRKATMTQNRANSRRRKDNTSGATSRERSGEHELW